MKDPNLTDEKSGKTDNCRIKSTFSSVIALFGKGRARAIYCPARALFSAHDDLICSWHLDFYRHIWLFSWTVWARVKVLCKHICLCSVHGRKYFQWKKLLKRFLMYGTFQPKKVNIFRKSGNLTWVQKNKIEPYNLE